MNSVVVTDYVRLLVDSTDSALTLGAYRIEHRTLKKRLFVLSVLHTNTPQAGVPNYFESSSKFIYRRIPVYDTPTIASDLKEAADEICSFIAKGLLRGSVLVHCQKGVSRSTTAVLMYLMRYVR